MHHKESQNSYTIHIGFENQTIDSHFDWVIESDKIPHLYEKKKFSENERERERKIVQ
jgi:hypothetical protein